ncbi:unnamed protein product [Pieris brassicae]|uniref:Uncharacterized protein n=1 Tax=Pieris brassicae TaxID=7116 RepID=A0A9P0TGQ7_PIEBR|nr:unnamed protein product [Pieris brassicae]
MNVSWNLGSDFLIENDLPYKSFAVCGLRIPGGEPVKQFGCRRRTKLNVTASNYISPELMSLRYFYLLLDVEQLDGGDQKSAVYAQSLFRKVCTELFGEAGAGHVDVLSVRGSQVVVRLRPDFLRSFRAAIALSTRRIHVCREAPSLQALL